MTVLENILHTIKSNVMEQRELFTDVTIFINGNKNKYISASLMVIEFKRNDSNLIEKTLVNQLSLFEAADITGEYNIKNTLFYDVRSDKMLSLSEIKILSRTDFRKLFHVYDGCSFNELDILEKLDPKVLQKR